MFFSKKYPLKNLNTFSIDCYCEHFAQFKTLPELINIFDFINKYNLAWYPLGAGSNIIFDGNFDGVIVQSIAKNINFEGGLVVADAGVVWDDLVAWCVERGLAGLENLSYIPGSVGASPVQNVGAYGSEAGDNIVWVDYFNVERGEVERIAGGDCNFGYRDSIFKNELRGKVVVIRVAFKVSENFDPSTASLNYGDLKERVVAMGEITLANIRKAVIEIRREKLPEPSVEPNAGSFFKNPIVEVDLANKIKANHPHITLYPTPNGVKVPAGALIDIAGWKGKRIGAVGVHCKQALVIVNYDNGSAADILALAKAIQNDIENRFGVKLNMEVNVV